MVIEEKEDNASQPSAVTQNAPLPASIDNIMSGISNTGSVKMNNHRKKLRQRFDIIKKLGQGTYGKVQLGINKETSQEVAIKTIKKCKIETEADLVRIRREVQIMSSVQHPNIIHIYEVFENREKMVLVMEFAAGGELYDYLSERKVLTEEEARRIFRQIATAVYYCHKHKICHRDLKLENILLDENGNAKIADFGLSNVFDDKRLLATFCGSPLYASPEIVKGTPYQGPEVDCWSLGVLLYTLVYGAMPFDGSNFKRLVKQISAGDYYEPKKPSNASPLIREMLTVCPKRRATVEQICNHWWVNEGQTSSCLDLAEQLANQTPVRLDVLLSLAPSQVTSDQLVVTNPNEGDNKQNVSRSMSVGSIREISDIANTEAERRIIDMVTAGGEAALAPSPTRTITPSPSAALQVKRKPETTISTDSMTGARKRDKPTEQMRNAQSKLSISEIMDVEENEAANAEEVSNEKVAAELSSSTLPDVLNENEPTNKSAEKLAETRNAPHPDTLIEEIPANTLLKTMTDEPKVAKTFNKNKTTDLGEISSQPQSIIDDDAPKPSTERRKSRILEAAEKFESAKMIIEKPKKFIPAAPTAPKKDLERKISLPTSLPSSSAEKPKQEILPSESHSSDKSLSEISKVREDLSKSNSKSSNLSLEEARRSMENSIALLNQAKIESNTELDQLCAKTESVAVSSEHDDGERQKKLKNAREIIGNAIPRLSGMGIRKPPVPFGVNGRSVSGSVVPSATGSTTPRNVSTPPDPKLYERESPLSIYNTKPTVAAQPEAIDEEQPTKVSTAEITLKSATLPRRKIDAPKVRGRSDIEQPIRENQYQSPYNAVYQRATSQEPQQSQQQKPKEHYIPIQRVGYPTSAINTTSSQRNVLSRQSTNDSDTSDTQTATSTTTVGTQNTLQTSASSQPIKKSPREFIIPIAVEGGGFITPRAGSLEPSESNHSTSTAFSRFGGRTRKLSSLFNDSEDESTTSPFHRMHRHTSIGRDSDTETDPTIPRFTYRLRSTRPVKKSQSNDGNDSASSGEEDDEDGFEILTAENLFSTLLSRVRALTNRLNVKDDPASEFPTSRFMNNLRQAHSPFWHHDPFTSRLNSSGAWRHSMTRDLGTDIDSVFSTRTGATLPRGVKSRSNDEHNVQLNESTNKSNPNANTSISTNPTITETTTSTPNTNQHNDVVDKNKSETNNEILDLADLDLSQLRLTKKDLETLSSITPTLPKHFQDQLLAQLPPNQARKLSRTLSMQGTGHTPHIYKRSLSSGREMPEKNYSSKVASVDEDEKSPNEGPSLLSFDRNSILRRSMSRSRDHSVHRRSTSAIRCELPTRLSYTGDLRTDYNALKSNDTLAGRYRLNDYTSALPPTSVRSDYYSKLPLPSTSFANSPVPPQKSPSNEAHESPIRRRSSQRGLSRFLRPDFYGSSSNVNSDESTLTRTRRERERETQSVLREIRERSRDRAKLDSVRGETPYRTIENGSQTESTDCSKEHRRKSSIPNIRITVDKQNGRIYHARNKSVERCCDIDDSIEPFDREDKRRASIGVPRNASRSIEKGKESTSQNQESASNFTDQILSEMIRESREYSKKLEQNGDTDTVKKSKTKLKDGKKSKSKQKSIESIEIKKSSEKLNNPKMVNDLTNEIQSVTLPMPKSSKIARPKSYLNKEENECKLERKNDDKPEQKSTQFESQSIEKPSSSTEVSVDVVFKPKTHQNSKLTPPKEVSLKTSKKSQTASSATASSTKNAITAAMEKFIEKSTERLSPGKSLGSIKTKSEVSDETSPLKTKKKVKVVKRMSKSDQSSPTKEASPKKADDSTSNETSPTKERKSPEKKLKSGFLYTIGQKFEKMRENSKNKEKERKLVKSNDSIAPAESQPKERADKVENVETKIKEPEVIQTIIIPRRIKDKQECSIQPGEEITIRKIELPSSITGANTKPDQRKSRIDAVIRNLRERSVPHTIRAECRESELATESGLLKRAVSVEDMTNGIENFNKSNVNKVLGLFRRIEREQQLQKQQQYTASANPEVKERPKSGGFVSKLKKSGRPYYTGAKSDTIITLTDQLEKQYLSEKANQALVNSSATQFNSKIPYSKSMSSTRPEKTSNNFDFEASECVEDKKKMQTVVEIKPKTPSKSIDLGTNQRTTGTNSEFSEKERIRNNRKGLVLDLNNEQYNEQFKLKSNSDRSNNNTSYHYGTNGHYTTSNGHCNGTTENSMNNNYHFYGHSDRNNDIHTPSYELSKNYSSDNRSFRDDCESTSTFLSPMDEPELCFDDWSACSGSTDDHAQLSSHPKQLKYSSLRSSGSQHEPNHNQHSCPTSTEPAASTPSDSESVIDRIKRRSFYCRFNEKKPKRTSSILGPTAQREYYRDMANKSKPKLTDFGAIPSNSNSNSNSNGLHTDGESSSYSRGGSKSPTPMNIKEMSSRATTPSCYSTSTGDENEKSKPQLPQYHYHSFHHNRSQTPSRATRSPFEHNDAVKVKSSDYLNLRSTLTSPPAISSSPKYYSNSSSGPTSLPTVDYQLNGNHRPYSLRNSTYDPISSTLTYGTYNPKRRMSTSYLAPSLAASNSNGYSNIPTEQNLSTSCYATFGRTKPKAYEHRTLSLLDTGTISPSSLISKRIGPSSHSTTDSSYSSYYRPVHDYGHFNSRSSLRSPVPQTSTTSNV